LLKTWSTSTEKGSLIQWLCLWLALRWVLNSFFHSHLVICPAEKIGNQPVFLLPTLFEILREWILDCFSLYFLLPAFHSWPECTVLHLILEPNFLILLQFYFNIFAFLEKFLVSSARWAASLSFNKFATTSIQSRLKSQLLL
jgi:hypothetical protein